MGRKIHPSSAKHFPKVSVPFCRLPLRTLHSSTRACSAWEPVAVYCTGAAWVQTIAMVIFHRLYFQGAPRCTDLQSRLFTNREVTKKRNPSSDSRSLLLGSNPFQRPLAVMGTRHLPPVSAWLSTSVLITFWRHRF
jgi:hypothetical protein